MVSHSLPSPPAEGKPTESRKSSSKSTKSTNRVAKRSGSGAASMHRHEHVAAHDAAVDGRRKRVWKACERCRMKKTKCNGEFPCKRCKDDGLVCTAGVRKKVEYKQLPRGYAEVLENSQFALIATVHKLYSMIRNSRRWELAEPDLNDCGLPVINDIVQKLGCMRPNSDIDLPVHTVFPEDEAGMNELARRLEEQQPKDADSQEDMGKDTDSSIYHQSSRASSSELDHDDFEDYRSAAFGRGSTMAMSPHSFAGSSNEFDFSSAPVPEMNPSAMFASQAATRSLPNLNNTWCMPKAQPNGMAMHYMHQVGPPMQNMNMMGHGMADADFGIIKPDSLGHRNSDPVMMGLDDNDLPWV